MRFVGSFKLNEKSVIISDPCYKKGSWYQGRLDNVKPGIWKAAIKRDVVDGMITELIAYHSDAVDDVSRLDGRWKKKPFPIGVDSGQAGFFQESVYRNDNTSRHLPDYFEDDPHFLEGDRWYGVCCGITILNGAGVLENGVVSASGIGDGVYTLYTVEKDGEVIAMKLIFCYEDEVRDR
jgi:hypothetical protein